MKVEIVALCCCQKCKKCLNGLKSLGLLFAIVIVFFVGQVMSHFDIVFVFAFVIVLLFVRLCLIITLIKCLKGHMSLGSLLV